MPFDIARVKAFCFDIDGTLRNTDDQYVEKLVKLMNPFKWLIPISKQRSVSRYIIMAIENPGNFFLMLPDRFGLDKHLEAFEDFVTRKMPNNSQTYHSIIEGAPDVLSFLSQNYPLAIVSARGMRMTEAFIDYFQLGGFFHLIVGAQTCQHTKPYPDPIQYVAEKLNIHPSSCVMVGDTTVDVRAGIAAGAQTIAVLSGFGQEDELKRAGADIILDSVADIPNLFPVRDDWVGN